MSDDFNKLEIIRLLDFFFDGDKVKCIQWVSCPSLDFGGHSPNGMIKSGKSKEVLDHVRKVVFEYSWPEDCEGKDFEKLPN
jgi:hypothetical protein